MQAAYIFAYMSYYAYFHNYLHLFQSAALFTEGVGQVKRFTIPVTPEMLILLLDLPIFIKLVANYDRTAELCRSLKKPIRLLRLRRRISLRRSRMILIWKTLLSSIVRSLLSAAKILRWKRSKMIFRPMVTVC